jgi:PAS domain S-box-containing protein
VDKLLSGEFDAISAYVTDEPFQLKQANFDYSIISPRMGGIDFYGDVLFSTEAMIKSQPKMVANFSAASLKGWQYAMEHPEEIVQLIYNTYSKRHSMEHLRYEAEKMKSFVMADVVEIGYSNPGRWNSIADTYKKLNMLDESFSTEGLFYSDYTRALSTNTPWYLIFIFLFAVIMLSAVFYLFYRNNQKLKNEIISRQQTENELRISEVRFREMANLMPQIVFEMDEKGRLSYVNEQAHTLLGYEKDEIKLGENTLYFHIPSERKRIIEGVKRTMRGDPLINVEYSMLRKDGSTFTALIYTSTILRNGKPVGIRGMIVDVDKLKKTQEMLRKSEANLSEAQRIANVGSWEMNLLDQKLSCTQELYNVFDINAENFDGKLISLMANLDPEDLEIINAKIDNLEPITEEFKLLLKDGNVRFIFIKTKIETNKVGEPVKIIGVAQDITNRKQAEQEKNDLEQMHKFLQFTDKAIEQERLVISRELHDDVGQALTAVKMDLEIYKQTAPEEAAPINKIVTNVVETIKTVQRITAHLRPDILDELGLEAAMEWYSAEYARRYKINMLLKIDKDFVLSPDKSLIIFRIMQESLTNIARYAQATHVQVRLYYSDTTVHFIVSDNGIGIKETELNSKKSYGIMGMRERVNSLGGTFVIKTKKTGGTEIKAIVPI